MPGPRPKPTHLKLIQGNPGKRAINKNEPKPIGDLRKPPDWLSEELVKDWNHAIQDAPKGLLKKIDSSVLETWVFAKATHRAAAMKVAELGLVTASPVKGEPMQNPYLAIVNRQAQIMLKAAGELGFTPSSRSKVSVVNDDPDGSPPSRFDSFKA